MGPALGTAESLDASLRGALQCVAIASGCTAALVIGLALVGELLRRRRRGAVVVSALDRWLPSPATAAAAAMLSALSFGVGAYPAHAAPTPTARVRAWLQEPSAPTTVPTTEAVPTSTTTPSVATPRALDQRQSAPRPSGGSVVHIPSGSITRPGGSRAQPPPARPATPLDRAAVPARDTTEHIVQRGECLWSIAARQLGPRATNRMIDAAWRRIYAANSTAVGPDPNLIRPGLVLALPPLDDLR
ncbi:MAG TPA: hypothetical protein VIC35_10670 [Acidimicrobiia bacterium]|jgi:nucleoid-associated protein YgaU